MQKAHFTYRNVGADNLLALAVHDVDALVAPDHKSWDLNGGEASFHVERNAGKVVDPIVAPTSEFILPDTGVELGTQPATT